MTKPAILTEIDTLLVDTLPAGIRAMAEGRVLSEVQDYLAIPGARVTQYEGVNISRSLAQVENGWMVRVVDGFEVHPRDPDTGQFVAREGT